MAKELSEKELKKLAALHERMAKSGFDLSDSYSKSSKLLGSISSQLFGMGESKIFDQIKFSSDDLSKMANDLETLNDELEDGANSIDRNFANALKAGKGYREDFAKLNSQIEDISTKFPSMAKDMQDAMSSGDFSKMSDDAMKSFRKLVDDKKGFGTFKKFLDTDAIKDYRLIEQEIKKIETAQNKVGEKSINWKKTLDSTLERLSAGFNLGAITKAMGEFDQTIVNAQRESGLFLANNFTASKQFAVLTSNAQQFGMSMADTTKLMGTLGSTLRTTDVGILSGAANDMAAIKNATGLAVEEVGELGGQMMLMGKTSKDVNKLAESTMKSAMNFGVNGRKIMQDIAKNLPKFRNMGFQGGEESLKRMALQAERMGQNIDEIFDMSTKARNIEGAMDMAAELQLAGGSFANINPMDLLSAARKGPEELQKILGQMGGDIGKFDKATGEMAFDAVDYDRLQMVATATGMSVDSLQKQISTMNKDAQKTELLPPGLFDGLNPEEKAFLLNNVGKDGSITMSGGIDGVSDLNSLTKDNIKAQLETQAKEKGTLEEQAKQNTSFSESIANLKGAIMNLFVFFEPIIKGLTSFVQVLSGAPVWLKVIFAGLMAGLALLFSVGKQVFNGKMFGIGFKQTALGGEGGGIKEMLGGKKKGGDVIPTAGAEKVPEGGKPGGFLESLAEGLKSFGKGSAQILKGAATLSLSAILIGAALIAITAGIASAGGDASGGQLLTFGVALVGLSGTMWLMSKILGKISAKDILMGSFAMLTIGAAFLPFAVAMKIMEGISWEVLAIAAVGIIGLSLIVAGLGAIMTTGIGAVVLEMGVVFLMSLGLGMAALGAGLLMSSAGFSAMAGVDWNSLMNIGPTLLMIAAAGALGLVGSFGIIGMAFSLGALAAVMVVLAPAMSLAAASTKSMAEGITQLKEAIKGLDTSKLESLASASERISTGSAMSGIANAISGALGGGKEEKATKVTVDPITINLQLDGKTLRTIHADTHAAVTTGQ